MTTGGTGSILHALVAYREHARETRGVTRPNFVKPETGHAAFDKGCHLFGIELRVAPVDPKTTLADVDAMAELVDDQTIAIMGSAGNYAYGTVDPIAELAALASERGVGMHVDGCLGGFILPFGQELGYDIPVFDFRVPGVTSISADTHKYGYAFKGSSTLLFRDKALRNAQYFHLLDWSGGKYMSPGMEGSRSGGLIASTWASMVSLGREGYREHAREIFETAAAMMDVVRSHPELRIMGDGTSGRADVLLLLHLRRVRDLPPRRLPRPEGVAVQRPAVPQRDPHGRHPPADPRRRRRGLHRRPGRGDRLREGQAGGRGGGLRRRDLRRVAGGLGRWTGPRPTSSSR